MDTTRLRPWIRHTIVLIVVLTLLAPLSAQRRRQGFGSAVRAAAPIVVTWRSPLGHSHLA